MTNGEATGSHPRPAQAALCCATWVILIGLCVFLRAAWLQSDAYHRLSWSSALLTDEGFYVHNARNVALFGHARTDEFNNELIMPLLHLAQVAVFKTFGVGVVQARLISVVCSLAALALLIDAARLLAGWPAAFVVLLFYGLDHANLLYNRLALMDTPGALFLAGGIYGWVRHEKSASEAGAEQALFACGLALGAGYAVRGLIALAWLPPLWILMRRSRRVEPPTRRRLFAFVAGLALPLGAYTALWWLPHRREIGRLDHYYLAHQLLPHSAAQVARNVWGSISSWSRGLFPYLARHMPVQLALCIAGICAPVRAFPSRGVRECGTCRLLAGVVALFWLTMSLVDYAPSRYYVLFYPAVDLLAALVLARRVSRAQVRPVPLAVSLLCCWALVNCAWLVDWSEHLTYRQHDASLWLGSHLPPGSVLLGDVAPGLCLDNSFVAVNVIPGLCNFRRPVERFAPTPRFVAILDGEWKESWWVKRYPRLVVQERRLHYFPHMLRRFLGVGIYPVGSP